MYQKIFFDVLEVSIIVTIMILVTFLFITVIDKRYGFRWRKILWLIFAVRLLIPYNFTFPDTPIRLFQSEKIFVQDGVRTYLTEPEIVHRDTSSVKDTSNSKAEKKKAAPVPSEEAFQIPFLLLIGIIWGIGVFIYLRNQQLHYQYFRNDTEDSIPIKTGRKLWLLQEVCEEMKIRKPPKLYIHKAASSPFIIGYFRPELFLPDRRYTEKELEFIYRHECTHYKSHDLIYKLIITIAVGMHWFNPVVHYMKTLAFRDIELVCDQKLAKHLTLEEKRLYCNTLINTASADKVKELNLSTCFLGNKKILKQRIQNIFHKRRWKKGVLPLFLILIALFAGSLYISCGKEITMQNTKKVVKEEDSDTPEKEKPQTPTTHVMTVTAEEKEWLESVNLSQIENFYCRNAKNLRNEYRIDDKNVLLEGNHELAKDVVHISSNGLSEESFLIYVTASGELYGTGSNSSVFFTDPYDEAVIDTPKLLMNNVIYAVCGSDSVTALKTDGTVWVWGNYRAYGKRYEENAVSAAEGNAFVSYETPTCILKNASYITSGHNIAAAVTKDGALWTWGSNLYGECGDEDTLQEAMEPGKRAASVSFVWFDREYSRMYLKKTDGSYLTCGQGIGSRKKWIDYGAGNAPVKVTCTGQLMPLVPEAE